MHMKLIEPVLVRTLLGRKQNWLSVVEIATGLGLHQNTVRKMLRGETISEDTVREVAAKVDKHPLDIATFVN